MTGDKEEKEDVPSLEDFIGSNYRLFTVIGVFGALAVYLTDFTSEMDEVARVGVGGVLLLFALASLIALKNTYVSLEKARKTHSYRSVIGYSIFLYSILALLLSLLWILGNEYPQGSGSVLAAGLIYSTLFIYYALIFRSEFITGYQSKTRLQAGFQYAPYISAGILAIWYTLLWRLGNPVQLIHDSPAMSAGSVFGILLIHFTLTTTILISIRLLDYTMQT